MDNSIIDNNENEFFERRLEMVRQVVSEIQLTDSRVVEALKIVPRHMFVDEDMKDQAYIMRRLAIKDGWSISDPEIVAYMTQALNLRGSDRVLEVGGGTGYHASVLAQLASHVCSVEVIPKLVKRAQIVHKKLGYNNIDSCTGNGALGLPEKAPFDAISVACASPIIPPELIRQLKVGGRMIIPIGPTEHVFPKINAQKLVLVEKLDEGQEMCGIKYEPFIQYTELRPIYFVPLTDSSDVKSRIK